MPLQLQNILFDSVEEGETVLVPSAGKIPTEIAGTYYLNGPANFRRGDFTYQHWLDGDGLVRALQLRDGKAEHVMRYVRTKKYADELVVFGCGFGAQYSQRLCPLHSSYCPTPTGNQHICSCQCSGKLFCHGWQQ